MLNLERVPGADLRGGDHAPRPATRHADEVVRGPGGADSAEGVALWTENCAER